MSTPKNHVKKALEANLSPKLPRAPQGSPAQRTLVQSWLSEYSSQNNLSGILFLTRAGIALPRRTRLVLSCIFFGAAAAGLYISDKLEEKLPAEKSKKTSTEHP